MGVASIGYLRIESTDTAAWMDFGTNILGLMDANREDTEGARYLRMDDHPFRFMLEPGDADRLLACGLEFRDQTAWETTCQGLAAAGHELTAGTAEQAERRCVSGFASVTDPSGNLLELYYGRKLDYATLISPVGIRQFITGDETTGDMGFGHAVLPAPATEETIAFYQDLIGLGPSDDLYPPMPEGAPEARVYFMHADNPRQHSLARGRRLFARGRATLPDLRGMPHFALDQAHGPGRLPDADDEPVRQLPRRGDGDVLRHVSRCIRPV